MRAALRETERVRTETLPLPFLGKRPDISVVGWAYGEGLLGRGPAAWTSLLVGHKNEVVICFMETASVRLQRPSCSLQGTRQAFLWV